MKVKTRTMVVSAVTIVGALLVVGWATESNMPGSGLSLEGIWTTMVQAPSGHASINSFVINAQGAEGMVYTVIGKHPQCSVTGLGLFPECQRLSDMMGYCVRNGTDTFRLSVIYHGVKEGGPERMGIGEILYMTILTGTLQFVDADTLQFQGTLAAYTADQDADGDRLPDEGAIPVMCAPTEQSFKRLPMFDSCEPTPLPFAMP